MEKKELEKCLDFFEQTYDQQQVAFMSTLQVVDYFQMMNDYCRFCSEHDKLMRKPQAVQVTVGENRGGGPAAISQSRLKRALVTTFMLSRFRSLFRRFTGKPAPRSGLRFTATNPLKRTE